MAPSHVRTAARLHVKQLTGESAGQPLREKTGSALEKRKNGVSP
jgi:hypothetical protein